MSNNTDKDTVIADCINSGDFYDVCNQSLIFLFCLLFNFFFGPLPKNPRSWLLFIGAINAHDLIVAKKYEIIKMISVCVCRDI